MKIRRSSKTDPPHGLLFEILSHASPPTPATRLLGSCSSVPAFLTVRQLEKCLAVCRRWYVDLNSRDNLRRRFPFDTAMPTFLRPRLWSLLMHGESPLKFTCYSASELRAKLTSLDQRDDIIDIRNEIDKDICRTYTVDVQPKSSKREAVLRPWGLDDASATRVFTSLGQLALRRMLLLTLGMAPVPTGYCQGMNYLAALFLGVWRHQDIEAAECFYHFLYLHGGLTRFDQDFAYVHSQCELIKPWFTQRCPLLSSTLENHKLQIEIFLFSWILLIFTYDVQGPDAIALLGPVWDQFLLRGDVALERVIRLVLCSLEAELSPTFQFSYEEIIHIIKTFPARFFAEYNDDPARILRDAASLLPADITPLELPVPPSPQRPVMLARKKVWKPQAPPKALSFLVGYCAGA